MALIRVNHFFLPVRLWIRRVFVLARKLEAAHRLPAQRAADECMKRRLSPESRKLIDRLHREHRYVLPVLKRRFGANESEPHILSFALASEVGSFPSLQKLPEVQNHP